MDTITGFIKYFFVVLMLMEIGELAYSGETLKDGIIKKYYKTGQLKSEVNKKDYTIKNYNKSGQLESEVIFKDKGLTYGIYREFYKNGKLKSEGNFKGGGEQLEGELYFKDGELIDWKDYDEEEDLISLKGYKRGFWRWQIMRWRGVALLHTLRIGYSKKPILIMNENDMLQQLLI